MVSCFNYILITLINSQTHCWFKKKSKLLRNDKDLMPCILETIGQLKISKEELAQIQIDMIPVIHHTPPDGLPSLVKFLIKVDDRKVAIKVIFLIVICNSKK